MKLVIFGLTVSSSWGNGHATIWRALCAALRAHGHRVVFFEQDRPYYAAHRDLGTLPAPSRLELYATWDEVAPRARREAADADVAIVTSYCSDAIAASRLLADLPRPIRVFYDLDTPVTLAALEAGREVDYLGVDRLAGYDLVLSYTGGRALGALRERLGARRVAALYGCVDPEAYRPAPFPRECDRFDLSYLGTYAADRQPAVEELFLEPARRRGSARFLLGGAQYPAGFPWSPNIFFRQHVAPAEHPAFYAESRLTLNVTREAMKAMGYCPSGRLFEAAACGVPLVSDRWEGLEQFFVPGSEILIAQSADGVLRALDLPEAARLELAAAARERVLAEHTAAHRVRELEDLLASTPAAEPEPTILEA